MITVSIYDIDINSSYSSLKLTIGQDQQVINCFPTSISLNAKDCRIQLRNGSNIIGSIKIPYNLLNRQLNIVRWFTLFDPMDDCYDGDMSEDDLESPRILLRLENGQQQIKQNPIIQKYNKLKEDLLKYRELSENELQLCQNELEKYQNDNQQLRQQLTKLRAYYENCYQESIQDIQFKLSTLEDEIQQEEGVPSNLVDKIKQCFQNIQVAYDSLQPRT